MTYTFQRSLFRLRSAGHFARVWQNRNEYTIFLERTRRKETTLEWLLVGLY